MTPFLEHTSFCGVLTLKVALHSFGLIHADFNFENIQGAFLKRLRCWRHHVSSDAFPFAGFRRSLRRKRTLVHAVFRLSGLPCCLCALRTLCQEASISEFQAGLAGRKDRGGGK